MYKKSFLFLVCLSFFANSQGVFAQDFGKEFNSTFESQYNTNNKSLNEDGFKGLEFLGEKKEINKEEQASAKESSNKEKFAGLFFENANPIGLRASEEKVNEAYDLIKQHKYAQAKPVLKKETEWLIEATEYHTSLFKILRNIENATSQADIERDLALRYAVLRDKALYLSAMISIKNRNPKDAVKKLVDVVLSQPKTKLGFDAYEQLQKIGFTYKVQLQAGSSKKDSDKPKCDI